jgi:hypothetical protein
VEVFSGTSSPRREYTVVRTLVLKVQKESMGGKPIVVTVPPAVVTLHSLSDPEDNVIPFCTTSVATQPEIHHIPE